MAEESKIEESVEDMLSQAKGASSELKGLLEENKKVLERIERLKAEEMLKGRSEAGVFPDKPKEESNLEYARRILTGRIKK